MVHQHDKLLEAFQRNEVEIMTSGFTMFCEDLRREGMEKGMERGTKKVALLMIKSGEPLAKVKLYTGLSEKELLALKQELGALEQQQ